MADSTFRELLTFEGTVAGRNFEVIPPVLNNPDMSTVRDIDGSGTPTAGDFLSFDSIPYSGFTTELNGLTYAVFGPSGGIYFIPHGGELSILSLPAGGETFTISFQDDVPVANCLSAGTRIATPAGEVAVEALGIGDLVTTADGRDVEVLWIGRQTVVTRFGGCPVRVRAGALGDGLPVRDLVLTADHALLIDGLLVNAGALVNGGSIDFMPLAEMGARYTVYHIETEHHDVILAEGTPAETYIDYVGRQAFDNYAQYVALYGEDRGIVENPVPRVTSARQVPPALKARLAGDVAA